jgi:hypothetical protein
MEDDHKLSKNGRTPQFLASGRGNPPSPPSRDGSIFQQQKMTLICSKCKTTLIFWQVEDETPPHLLLTDFFLFFS